MIRAFIILALIAGLIAVFGPGKILNKFVLPAKDRALDEGQLIGNVAGSNPRVMEIQTILKHARFYNGQVDGVIGKETREALRNFQIKNDLDPTGKVDRATQVALNREKLGNSPDASRGNFPQGGEISRQDNLFAEETSRKKIMVEDEIIKYRMNNGQKEERIQTALKNAGFYKGKIDGKIGPMTRQAIKEFQQQKQIPVNGRVDSATWEELQKYLKP